MTVLFDTQTRAMRVMGALLVLAALASALVAAARAEPKECGREAFARAFDAAGARLRTFSQESQPRLRAALKQLRQARGWSEEEEAEKAEALLADAESRALDDRAAELLAALDRLAAEGSQGAGDCARLSELEATAQALIGTIRRKAELMEKRIAAAVGASGPAAGSALGPLPERPGERGPPSIAPPLTPPPPALPPVGTWSEERTSIKAKPLPEPRPRPAPQAEAPAPPPAATPPVATIGPWQVTTSREAEPPRTGTFPSPAPPAALTTPPSADTDSYTIDEIRAIARGVFGTISTSLASVIEHAFSYSGRPTAYVLGQEGGIALIAGVRYGQGRLYLKGHPPQRIFWHGPSVGYDFGAAGSRTLFLVYGARDHHDLLKTFTGIDGAAYLVGGAGITFLTDGKIVLAPIRSGLGLRLGASIGYLRFTERPTWLPF